MNVRQSILIFIGFIIYSSLTTIPVLSQNNPTQMALSQPDSSVTVEGTIVCINEELAKIMNTKPKCDQYGHLYGLKTSDGIIWSFMLNPLGMKLRKDDELRGKKVSITGRLFYNAKIIEVKDYFVIPE